MENEAMSTVDVLTHKLHVTAFPGDPSMTTYTTYMYNISTFGCSCERTSFRSLVVVTQNEGKMKPKPD